MATTRTIHGVKIVKASAEDTRSMGAASVWMTQDGRFEIRADICCERPSEIEWGVWDRQRGHDGDWAFDGAANGVCPNTMREAVRMIAQNS